MAKRKKPSSTGSAPPSIQDVFKSLSQPSENMKRVAETLEALRHRFPQLQMTPTFAKIIAELNATRPLGLPDWVRHWARPKEEAVPPPKRKRGGGRPDTISKEVIDKAQTEAVNFLKANPTAKQDDVTKHVGDWLGKKNVPTGASTVRIRIVA